MLTMQAASLSHPRDTALIAEIPPKPAIPRFFTLRVAAAWLRPNRTRALHKRESVFGTAFASPIDSGNLTQQEAASQDFGIAEVLDSFSLMKEA
jgi:hypothetical protein